MTGLRTFEIVTMGFELVTFQSLAQRLNTSPLSDILTFICMNTLPHMKVYLNALHNQLGDTYLVSVICLKSMLCYYFKHLHIEWSLSIASPQDTQLESHGRMLQSFSEDLSLLTQSLPEGRKAKAREMEEYRLREEYLQHEVGPVGGSLPEQDPAVPVRDSAMACDVDCTAKQRPE